MSNRIGSPNELDVAREVLSRLSESSDDPHLRDAIAVVQDELFDAAWSA